MKKYLLVVLVVLLALLPVAVGKSKTDPYTIVLSDNNTVVLNTAIDENAARDTQLALMNRAAALTIGEPIFLFLNTPGGSISSGLDIIETAKGLRNPVHTISKFSASMGFIISQYLAKRYVLSSAILMAHRAKISGLSGEVPGSAFTRLGAVLSVTQRSDNQAALRANMSVNNFQALIANELWLDSFTAVQMQFADQRVNVRCDASLQGTYTKKFDAMIAVVIAEFSKCPLIEAPVSIKFEDSNFSRWMDKRNAAQDTRQQITFEAVREAITLMLTDRQRYYNDYIKTGLHERYFR